ncbi:HAD family hydrolase [archaeon]
MNPKAVILDVDGTLIDSTSAITKRHELTAEKMGLRKVGVDEFMRESGKGWREIIHELWPEVDVEKFVDVYFTTPKLPYPAVPGAIDAVRKLKAQGFVLGIVTGKSTYSAEDQLKEEGFDLEWFDFVHGEDALAACKPNAGAFDNALTILGLKGITKEETVYVGDSPNDEAAAIGAGLRFIAVLTGHNTKEDFGGVEIIESVAELPDALS